MATSPLDQDEIIRRISLDVADGYDEELEMEIEDRHPLPGVAQGPDSAKDRNYRQDYFRQLFRLTDEEQYLRFLGRIHDPLKQWKPSPMDLESRRRWENYTRAKDVMLERSHIAEAPWWVVQAVDKKRARLNCIDHLLKQFQYHETPKTPIVLPQREHHEHYSRQAVPANMLVPEVY